MGGQIDPRGRQRAGDGKPAGFWRRWRAAIAERNLADPADVEELYGIAVALGCFEASPQNRLNVFVQAACDRRVAKVKGAIFRENVAWSRWFGSCADEDEARRMISELDLGLARRQPAAYEPEEPDYDSARQQQIAALRSRGRAEHLVTQETL